MIKKYKGVFVGFILGAVISYFLVTMVFVDKIKDDSVSDERVENFKDGYDSTLIVIAKYDTAISILTKERDSYKKSKDSIETKLHSNVKTVKELTVVKINNDDINEALLWIDSENSQ